MKPYEYLLNRSVIVLVTDLTVDNSLPFQKQKTLIIFWNTTKDNQNLLNKKTHFQLSNS